MSGKTKLIVLHMKEVIYTAIFLILLILLGILLYLMFIRTPNHSDSNITNIENTAKYIPGVYASPITLNDNTFDLTVTVDENRIKSINLVNLSESTAAMYPLMEPVLENLTLQIYENQSTENLSFDEDNLYTATLLLNAINKALAAAKADSIYSAHRVLSTLPHQTYSSYCRNDNSIQFLSLPESSAPVLSYQR